MEHNTERLERSLEAARARVRALERENAQLRATINLLATGVQILAAREENTK